MKKLDYNYEEVPRTTDRNHQLVIVVVLMAVTVIFAMVIYTRLWPHLMKLLAF